MTETYRHPGPYDPSPEDPIGVIVPYLDRPPKWVVIGGLGDVMEARQCVARWPGVRVVGVDPDLRAVEWQIKNGWPFDARIHCFALSDRVGTAPIRMDTICCPSMHPKNLAEAKPGEVEDVDTVTLDRLDRLFGPFDDCVLWLDLEGWDYTALRGAPDLLASGRVMIVGVEVRYDDPETNERMSDLLERAGFVQVLSWFQQWWGHNEVWKYVKS